MALWDRDPRVHEVARKIAILTTGSVHADEVDVVDATSVNSAFDRFTDEYGPADVVVHAAGVMGSGAALDITPETWDRSFAVNATGTMHVTQRGARDMVAAGRGPSWLYPLMPQALPASAWPPTAPPRPPPRLSPARSPSRSHRTACV